MILSFLPVRCKIGNRVRVFVRRLLLRRFSLLSLATYLLFWRLRCQLWYQIWSFSSFFLSLGIMFRCPRVSRTFECHTVGVVIWEDWFFIEFPWLLHYRFLLGDYLRGRDYWVSYAFWQVDRNSWTVFWVLSCWHRC